MKSFVQKVLLVSAYLAPIVGSASPLVASQPAKILKEIPTNKAFSNVNRRGSWDIGPDKLHIRFQMLGSPAEIKLAKADQDGWKCKAVNYPLLLTGRPFYKDECEIQINLGGQAEDGDGTFLSLSRNPDIIAYPRETGNGRTYWIPISKFTDQVAEFLPKANYPQTKFVDDSGKLVGTIQEVIRTPKFICGYKLPDKQLACKMLLLGEWTSNDYLKPSDFEVERRGGASSGNIVGTSRILELRDEEPASTGSEDAAPGISPEISSGIEPSILPGLPIVDGDIADEIVKCHFEAGSGKLVCAGKSKLTLIPGK